MARSIPRAPSRPRYGVGDHQSDLRRPMPRSSVLASSIAAGAIAAITGSTLSPSAAASDEGASPLDGWLINTQVHARTRTHQLRSDQDINPRGAIFQSERNISDFVGRVQIERPGDAFVTVGLRPNARYDDVNGWTARLNIDEAYVDVMASPELFLFGGLKRTVSGVANGFNPTDFLSADKETDGLLRDEDRRAETMGDFVVGLEYFTNSGTFLAALLPEIDEYQETPTRLYLEYQGDFETIDADYSLNAVIGHSSALGYNVSATYGRASVIYSEGALHFRRDRDRLRTMAIGGGRTATFPDRQNDNRVYPEIALGATYTLANGISINGEYYHNARGYSEAEFDDISGLIDRAAPAFRSGDLRAAGDLGLASSVAFSSPLRQNYLFVRVSDVSIASQFDLELIGIYNIDDQSATSRARLTYEPTSTDRFELVGEVFRGDDRSEFGLVPFSERAMLTYRRLF